MLLVPRMMGAVEEVVVIEEEGVVEDTEVDAMVEVTEEVVEVMVEEVMEVVVEVAAVVMEVTEVAAVMVEIEGVVAVTVVEGDIVEVEEGMEGVEDIKIINYNLIILCKIAGESKLCAFYHFQKSDQSAHLPWPARARTRTRSTSTSR